MKHFYPIALLFSSLGMLAQTPTLQWSKSYGGSFGETVNNIEMLPGGGYIFSGQAASVNGDVVNNDGGIDAWIVKTDASGTITSQKTYGGTGYEQGLSVKQTPDGGFYMGGASGSSNGDVTDGNNGLGDVWVFKANSSGVIEWQKTLGGSNGEFATDVVVLSDGGCAVLCSVSSSNGDVVGNHGNYDLWVIRFGAAGQVVWKKALGGSQYEFSNKMLLTPANEIVVCASTSSTNGDVSGLHGSGDGWIVKLDENGNILWQRCYGGPGTDNIYDIQLTNDGNMIACGFSGEVGGDITQHLGSSDGWVIKIDQQGEIIWQKNYGGTGWDQAQAIATTQDGGYLVGFAAYSNDGDFPGWFGGNGADVYVGKLDASGNLGWTMHFGGNNEDYPDGIVQLADGSFAIACTTNSPNGDFATNHGQSDAFIFKISAEILAVNDNMLKSAVLSPNPCRDVISVSDAAQFEDEITIIDGNGRQVKKTKLPSGAIDVSGLTSGSYFISLTNKNGARINKPFIKE